MNEDSITLAIETSQVGSISLMKGGEEIGFWIGGKENSRSQDLVLEISRLLDENHMSKHDISLIAVATGPGSFTGLRVGISIAMGLSQALGCSRIGIPTLTAMSLIEPETDIICMVPAGKEQCYWQAFKESKATTKIHLTNTNDLKAVIEKQTSTKVVSEFYSIDKLKELFTETKIIPAPENLARLIGLSALANYESESFGSEIFPLYVRDASVRF